MDQRAASALQAVLDWREKYDAMGEEWEKVGGDGDPAALRDMMNRMLSMLAQVDTRHCPEDFQQAFERFGELSTTAIRGMLELVAPKEVFKFYLRIIRSGVMHPFSGVDKENEAWGKRIDERGKPCMELLDEAEKYWECCKAIARTHGIKTDDALTWDEVSKYWGM